MRLNDVLSVTLIMAKNPNGQNNTGILPFGQQVLIGIVIVSTLWRDALNSGARP
jgi:hypothetical protein